MRNFAAAFIASVCIVATATPAQAQTRHYNVPAGSLRSALDAYARQSGRQIVYKADHVRGAKSSGAKGDLSSDAALNAILSGTGFTFRTDSSGAIAIMSGEAEAGSAAVENESASIITVTGSRIRGTPPIAPTTTQTAEQIEDEGFADLGNFGRSLTQNFSGGQNPGVLGGQGGSENVTSSTALNLRGLGPDATLTLINGHRVAYDAAAQGVDISAVPVLAVDRVEVVADGASALYGSDAVGGVANVILRRDFDGVLTSVRVSAATDGGQVEQRYSMLEGKRWDSGGFAVTLEYVNATPIEARQRSYTLNLWSGSTLVPGYKQISAVFAGHQAISDGVSFEVDGHYNKRFDVTACGAFTTTAGCTVNGSLQDTDVESYAINPTLRFELPHGWELAFGGTHARSDAVGGVKVFVQGNNILVSNARYLNSVDAVELNAEGPLLTLPGGDVRLALGGGYRKVGLNADVRNTTVSTNVTTPFRVFDSDRDVYYGYGEVLLPLVGTANAMPFVHKLEATGAVRYESTEGIGDIATPKLGLLYMPHRDIALSVTWGKSFKAPTLTQEVQVPLGFLQDGSSFNPTSPGGLPVVVLSGGNGNLAPERARTWTATLSYTPGFAEGLRLAASYFNLSYRDRVVTPIQSSSTAFQPVYGDLVVLNPTGQQVLDAVALLPQGIANQSSGPFNPAAIGAIVYNNLQNAAQQSIEGVDFAVSYEGALSSRDKLQIGASLTYLQSEQKLSSGQPVIQLAGTIFDPPHWRGRADATWERNNFSLTGVVSYIGSNLDDRNQPFVRVGAFTSVDAIARIRTADPSGPFANISATLSVLNLLNEKPDPIRISSATSYAFDSTNHSSIGRTVSLTITKKW